jgi:proteasome lid subunit RPN8/RPN11
MNDRPASVSPSSLVSLSSPALEAIRRHGQETYPHECCGALIGYAGGDAGTADAEAPLILVALPLPNTTEEGPRRRFLIRPTDYRDAEKAARSAELSLLGFYHSHPDHPAQPSQHDLDHAWPNLFYLIASVQQGRFEVVRAWYLRDDRSAFDERTITVVPQLEGSAAPTR